MAEMKRVRMGLILLVAVLLAGCASNIKDGITYLEEENYQAAVECFEKGIVEKNNLSEAYRGMGIAQYELGNYSAAVDAFNNALENEAEKTATIYNLMGASCLQLKEYEEALEFYAKALKMEDCTGEMKQEILFSEIAIYQELGDWKTVKEKVSAYVEAYPDDERMDKTVEFLETR